MKIHAAHPGRNDSRSIAIMSMFATSKILMDLSSAMLTSIDPSWLNARSAEHTLSLMRITECSKRHDNRLLASEVQL